MMTRRRYLHRHHLLRHRGACAMLIQLAISAPGSAADDGGAGLSGNPLFLAGALRKLNAGVARNPMNDANPLRLRSSGEPLQRGRHSLPVQHPPSYRREDQETGGHGLSAITSGHLHSGPFRSASFGMLNPAGSSMNPSIRPSRAHACTRVSGRYYTR